MGDIDQQNLTYIAGVDEAGRGPWAGPVVAAAVILDEQQPITGLKDSKQLSAKKRQTLAQQIKQQSLAWAIAQASVAEIDDYNILQASLLAMQRAIHQLKVTPDRILIDGNQLPKQLPCPAQAVVKGDQTIACISAAAILAKTWRDQLMMAYEKDYPKHGFAQHKGYGTKQHRLALQQWGITAIHRRSFKPVKQINHYFKESASS